MRIRVRLRLEAMASEHWEVGVLWKRRIHRMQRAHDELGTPRTSDQAGVATPRAQASLHVGRHGFAGRTPTMRRLAEAVRFLSMNTVTCIRCGNDAPRMAAPPFRNELGSRLFDSVCQSCWQDWLKEQTAMINHYALNVLDPKAKKFLTEQTETFFFGAKQA